MCVLHRCRNGHMAISKKKPSEPTPRARLDPPSEVHSSAVSPSQSHRLRLSVEVYLPLLLFLIGLSLVMQRLYNRFPDLSRALAKKAVGIFIHPHTDKNNGRICTPCSIAARHSGTSDIFATREWGFPLGSS